MRAVADTESLSVSEVPDPIAGPGEVVIDVVAAGVNRADLLQRRGAYPPPKGASEILGLEVSGRISAVGPDAGGWRVGDEVCALLAGGGYAEKVAVPAAQVLPVPAGVDLQTAAALPEVACTVVSNLILTANLRAGELLLIHGGSSGIGTHAIQLASALGARIAVTARNQAKLDRCAELGAGILIDYTTDDFAQVMKDNGGADVILDIMGAKYLPGNIAALRTGGRMVTIGLQGGVKGELNMGVLLAKRLSVFGTTLRSRPVDGPGGKGEAVTKTLEVTWPLIEAGRIVPIVDSVFGFDDAAAAHARLDSGDAVGKVLLRVGA
ncbi:zinc-binding dehydrogenase [Gordonia amarae]|uniref:Zinc-binding dehydrogenase n=1 Tax=Gordonia amarae TaxID=36821 RepID=A0A857KSH2_9ACTN|nr:NAD(P)H-quinone oxidoreductase [Gordonia amarae]MCS3876515.1 putative PIG3 family NAD(P)H quinone oxidoreductase [Gordonia amarae]QHN19420.1 zinc-binding dehydrogenase [Gordonia amarae]QHN23896.1 zinc-binding dehydrogenase [Gordonia amarae]QHN32806.1 zinc-binding dehydrogenase [Gordonia amarae]QHN41525.1 zinc-binding dehydrogenase [Gordonia amarae]